MGLADFFDRIKEQTMLNFIFQPGAKELIQNKVHRFARLWQITRQDGTIFRFTDHIKQIEFEGETFDPAGGISASAHSKTAELSIHNIEVYGMISSSIISFEDLNTGKFRNAEIQEWWVDWQYPWVGHFVYARFWITDMKFSGEFWDAQIEGLSRFLRPKIGNVYNRLCRHDFGDAACTINLATYTVSGTITTVDQQRYSFSDSSLAGTGSDYFNYGYVEWLTGNNAGLKHEIKEFEDVAGRFIPYLPTEFDIQIGDTFNAVRGCPKTYDFCLNSVNNLINFGGFPYTPGMDKMVSSPQKM